MNRASLHYSEMAREAQLEERLARAAETWTGIPPLIRRLRDQWAPEDFRAVLHALRGVLEQATHVDGKGDCLDALLDAAEAADGLKDAAPEPSDEDANALRAERRVTPWERTV